MASTDYSKWDKWAEDVESDDNAEANREGNRPTKPLRRPNIGEGRGGEWRVS